MYTIRYDVGTPGKLLEVVANDSYKNLATINVIFVQVIAAPADNKEEDGEKEEDRERDRDGNFVQVAPNGDWEA